MGRAQVRTATYSDAAEIARMQAATWRHAYATLLGKQVLAELDPAAMDRDWQHAIAQDAADVVVALEKAEHSERPLHASASSTVDAARNSTLVGFGAAGLAPAEETADAQGNPAADAEQVGLISALLVEARWGRRGHGGRLLAELTTRLRARGAARGITWVPEEDEPSRAFFARVDWNPDGLVRTLEAGTRQLREIRLTGPLNLQLTDG